MVYGNKIQDITNIIDVHLPFPRTSSKCGDSFRFFCSVYKSLFFIASTINNYVLASYINNSIVFDKRDVVSHVSANSENASECERGRSCGHLILPTRLQLEIRRIRCEYTANNQLVILLHYRKIVETTSARKYRP